MPTAQNRGIRINYRTHGRGEPIVLIHGWASNGRHCEELGYAAGLASDFEVILPDLRGHGDSDTPGNGDFSDAAFASDVIAVLDNRGLASAHVFGYSLGGWVAFELLAAYPSRGRTAIIGGAHPYDEDLSAIRGLTPQAIIDMFEAANAPLSEYTRKRLAASDPLVLTSMIPDRVNQVHRFERLPLPCLMICGTTDWRFDDMRRFAEGKANCGFVALEGLDHLQAFLQPDRLLPPLRNFVRAHLTERAG